MTKFLLWLNSGDLLAGDHALGRERDLLRTGRAKRIWNLEAPANLKHRDYVGHGNAFKQPQPGGCNINCSLRVVEGIGFVRTPFGQAFESV